MIKNNFGSSHTSPEEIAQILSLSMRLRYILSEHYHVEADEIMAIHIDRANRKLDIATEMRTLRFKPKGTRSVMLSDPDCDQLMITLDPALAQGIFEILEEVWDH